MMLTDVNKRATRYLNLAGGAWERAQRAMRVNAVHRAFRFHELRRRAMGKEVK